MHPTTFFPAAIFPTVAMVAALFSSVHAVWTCPSGRDPFCCARYRDEGKVDGVLIGSGCQLAPRKENCNDGSVPRCCKANFDYTYYCDSVAKGWT